MILLITRYNLSSRWVHLFMFLILYLICLKLHYIDLNNNNFVECMMRNPTTTHKYENPFNIVNKELFSKKIHNHAILLPPEELSSRINDNIRQIDEQTSIIHDAHQELSLKLQSLKNEGHSNTITSAGDKTIKLFQTRDNLNQVKEIHLLCSDINRKTQNVVSHLDSLHHLKSEQTARVVEDIQSRLSALEFAVMPSDLSMPESMLEADCKTILSNKIETPEAIDTSNFITVDQLTKSYQELYANIENSFKKELSTVSTLQTELTNEINTRKALETRVTNLEEELREIRRALMFRGTIMDPLVQHQITLNEVKQTTQENSIASIPR